MNTITLSKGGTHERTVDLETLQIPDCYCIAENVRRRDETSSKMINECWHFAHELKRHALELGESKAELLLALEMIYESCPLNQELNNIARAAIAKAKGN